MKQYIKPWILNNVLELWVEDQALHIILLEQCIRQQNNFQKNKRRKKLRNVILIPKWYIWTLIAWKAKFQILKKNIRKNRRNFTVITLEYWIWVSSTLQLALGFCWNHMRTLETYKHLSKKSIVQYKKVLKYCKFMMLALRKECLETLME